MRSNERLHRVWAIRQLGGGSSAICADSHSASSMASDVRLFALTFAGGFLFTTIFLA